MNTKKYLALLLAIVMTFACFPAFAIAATDTYQLVADSVVVDGSADKTVNVYFQSVGAEMTYSVEAAWSTSELEGTNYLTLSALTPATGVNPTDNNASNGKVYWMDTSYSAGVSTEAGGTIWCATYTVDKDTPTGTYTVSLSGKTTDKTFNANNFGELTATITVTESETPTAPYEVFYTLNGADSDTDKLNEFGIGDTVTATIWLKNNTQSSLLLQAYDVYLTHAAALKFSAVDGGVVAYNGNAVATVGGVVDHIQFVGENTTPITMDAGATVELGKISFTIDAAAAVYGEAMAITLVQAENDNESKQKDVTNFSVGTDAAGDKKSYYPAVIGEVLGGEVNTTWTITWKNEDGTALGEPATVGHGIVPVYSGETPVKENTAQYSYVHTGWTPEVVKATANATYTATFSAAVNTYTVTWNNWDGSLLKSETLEYGATPNYVGDTPTKPEEDKYTFEFIGWTPEVTSVTGDVTYTAAFKAVAKTFTVTFHPNGATGDTYTQTGTYGMEITLNPNTFTAPADKMFWNWNTAEDGSGQSYLDKGELTVEGDVTLYAQWVDVPKYTISCEATNGTVAPNVPGGAEHTEIILTVTPDPGYELKTITAVDANNNPVDLTETTVGVYTFTMPASNVTITATFEAVHYNITVTNPSTGTVEASHSSATIGTEVTLTATPAAGYRLNGFVVSAGETTIPVVDGKFNMPASNVIVSAVFVLDDLALTVTQNAEKGTVTAPETAQFGDEVTLTAEAVEGYVLTGYTVSYTENGELKTIKVGADGKFDMPAYPVTITANWGNREYSVTLHANDGTIADGANVTKYTFGTGVTLPGADKVTRENYVFGGWYTNAELTGDPVTAITATDTGDKVFYARWNTAAAVKIEDYTYATEDYVLIRVTDNLDPAREYQFNGVSMYWTDDKNYLVNPTDTGVFYLLIEKTYVENGELTVAGQDKLAVEDLETGKTRATIDYSGDINDDGVVNIADANVVYQMTIHGAGYYTMDPDTGLTIEQRLMADMDKTIGETNEDHRGSIEDVHAIVTVINTQPTT